MPTPPPAQRSGADREKDWEKQSRLAQWATVLTFGLADLVALLLVAGVIYLAVKPMFPAADLFASYGLLLAALPLFGLAYALSGLYRAATMHPVEELRRVSVATTVVVVSSTASALVVSASPSTTAVLAIAGALAMVAVPACRVFFRILFSRASWWGAPVMVLGSGSTGRTVIDTLKRWPELGLRPVALLQEELEWDAYHGTPVMGSIDLASMLASATRIPYAIVAMPDLSHRQLTGMLERHGRRLKQIFVVPDVPSAQTLWTTAHSYDGLRGYGVQHYTRRTGMQWLKRLFDIAFSGVALLLLAPLILIIVLLIKLDSSGPVFFKQERMSRKGRCFTVLKFRTMVNDAEAKLQNILQQDAERREEYQRYCKLKDDPRITPVGRWLRRYSLDELPQLWNVLVGQMSLVGPRAYLPSEQSRMDGLSHVVLQGPPGLTGLWQVSGRNQVSFKERVDLDVHYMQNWTLWLDLYILARTVPVVLSGEGAN